MLPFCAAAGADADVGREDCYPWWQFQVWLVQCEDADILGPQLGCVVDSDACPVMDAWDEVRVGVMKFHGHPAGAVGPHREPSNGRQAVG